MDLHQLSSQLAWWRRYTSQQELQLESHDWTFRRLGTFPVNDVSSGRTFLLGNPQMSPAISVVTKPVIFHGSLTISICDHGVQNTYVRPNHDVSLTLTEGLGALT